MTVIVEVTGAGEAATAASPRSVASVPLSHAYSALRSELGACPIELGAIGALADNECRHDRLPSDPTPPCGCWPQEVTKDPPLTLEEEPPMQPEPKTPVATSDAADLDDLPPFIRGLIEQLDDEIERLTAARNALVS